MSRLQQLTLPSTCLTSSADVKYESMIFVEYPLSKQNELTSLPEAHPEIRGLIFKHKILGEYTENMGAGPKTGFRPLQIPKGGNRSPEKTSTRQA